MRAPYSSWAASGVLHVGLLALALVLVPAGRHRPDDPVILQSAVTPAREMLDETGRLDLFPRREAVEPTRTVAERSLRDDVSDVSRSVLSAAPDELPPVAPLSCRAAKAGGGASLGVGRPVGKPGPGRGIETGGGSGTGGVSGIGRGTSGGAAGSEAESVIEAALQWLADRQNADGSWKLSPGWQAGSQPIKPRPVRVRHKDGSVQIMWAWLLFMEQSSREGDHGGGVVPAVCGRTSTRPCRR